MTESLVEWLSAQLDVDQKRAEVALRGMSGHWKLRMLESEYWMITDADGQPVVYDEGRPTDAEAAHIAAWDPARVLAEVAAKRRILDEHAPSSDHVMGSALHCTTCCGGAGYEPSWLESPCLTVRLLALPYAGRDGWREEWRPE